MSLQGLLQLLHVCPPFILSPGSSRHDQHLRRMHWAVAAILPSRHNPGPIGSTLRGSSSRGGRQLRAGGSADRLQSPLGGVCGGRGTPGGSWGTLAVLRAAVAP